MSQINKRQLQAAIGEVLKILTDLNNRVSKLENSADKAKQDAVADQNEPGTLPPSEGG